MMLSNARPQSRDPVGCYVTTTEDYVIVEGRCNNLVGSKADVTTSRGARQREVNHLRGEHSGILPGAPRGPSSRGSRGVSRMTHLERVVSSTLVTRDAPGGSLLTSLERVVSRGDEDATCSRGGSARGLFGHASFGHASIGVGEYGARSARDDVARDDDADDDEEGFQAAASALLLHDDRRRWRVVGLLLVRRAVRSLRRLMHGDLEGSHTRRAGRIPPRGKVHMCAHVRMRPTPAYSIGGGVGRRGAVSFCVRTVEMKPVTRVGDSSRRVAGLIETRPGGAHVDR